MNPGLVVKLRPTGPWRIGPDSGARNRVDSIYHSDSLYSAVTAAMGRLGLLDEWLEATARAAAPAVCFSSCFPFQGETQFVVPPSTIWPPVALLSARVRWKGARFVPLDVVQSILAGKALDEGRWTVDGPSECLVRAGQHGPFRTSVRWSAAVDRLTGATERHSTACIEFRQSCGLWTLVSFADEAAESKWKDRVKAAFRLLADTGFGGERSRGWGRAESPEFVEGSLPELVLGSAPVAAAVVEAGPPAVEASQPEAAATEPEPEAAPVEASVEEAEAPVAEAEPQREEPVVAAAEPEPAVAEAVKAQPEVAALKAPPALIRADSAHWLLSLFSPAPADTVDWSRGKYTLLTRGGRVESPAGSGELKKQVQMVTEGSVLYTASAPCGAAPDVAPDGFAHPVFRAGFALAIRLPEVS